MKMKILTEESNIILPQSVKNDMAQQQAKDEKQAAENQKKEDEVQNSIKSKLDNIRQKMQQDRNYIDSPEAITDIEQYLVGINLVNG